MIQKANRSPSRPPPEVIYCAPDCRRWYWPTTIALPAFAQTAVRSPTTTLGRLRRECLWHASAGRSSARSLPRDSAVRRTKTPAPVPASARSIVRERLSGIDRRPRSTPAELDLHRCSELLWFEV